MYRNVVGIPEGHISLDGPGVDGRIILEWFLGTWSGEVWTGFI
jgi:hypothetical protein